jgi:hypothetical protein
MQERSYMVFKSLLYVQTHPQCCHTSRRFANIVVQTLMYAVSDYTFLLPYIESRKQTLLNRNKSEEG